MGLVIAYRPEQCSTTAKTSEWERAAPKPRGGGGYPPATLCVRAFSRESLDPPPGTGRETTPQVITCGGPNRTTYRTKKESAKGALLLYVAGGRLLCHILAEPHENGGNLGPGGIACGLQGAILHALDDVLRHRPSHGGLGIVLDLIGVGIAGEVSGGGHVVALGLGVAVENGHQLLPGEVRQTIRVSASDGNKSSV